MRKLIILVVILNSTFPSFAQKIVAQNENVSPVSNMRPSTFEDYLVQLAWTSSPEAEGFKYEIDSKKQDVELAKREWFRNLQAGINVNDVSLPYNLYYNLGIKRWFGRDIDPTRFSSIATIPFWQVGVGLNFGDLINRKYKIKGAEDKRKMVETDLNFIKQKIKAEVLKRYQEYLVAIEILKVRLQSLDATESNKTQISSLFAINKASFQDYNEANKAYIEALESKIRSESEVKIKRLAIEELIGVKWESVEKVKVTYDQKEQKK